MTKGRATLRRRQFLKALGAAAGLALPVFAGYHLVSGVQGEVPPTLPPYAPAPWMDRWPASPDAAAPLLILVDVHSSNPFGTYLAEILRAEGLNCFQVARLSDLHDGALDGYDIVLLAESVPNSSHVEVLERFVAGGGQLVAMRPDARLAPLLGVMRLTGVTREGDLRVAADQPIGRGIETGPLRFHGAADHYRLAGAQAIAWLTSGNKAQVDLPAVTLHRYGRGQAAMWAFDLALSVAYTRQGNPALANQERDGLEGIRPCDMFQDWVDLARLMVPTADEQQRLLVNLIGHLSQAARPLPRLWYFPGAAETMLIATSDVHQNPAWAIEDMIERVERYGGHISMYYLPPLYEDGQEIAQRARWWAAQIDLLDEAYHPSPSQIAKWRARGHEFGLHPEVGHDLAASWTQYWKSFTGLGLGPVSSTTRTHEALWAGWVQSAHLQASFGIRMNLDYYHVGPAFRTQAGEWVHGYFTGSGLPMRFIDDAGRVLGIYQQPTQLADDHLLNLHWGGQVKLSAQAAVEVSQALVDNSLNGRYGAITAHFHADPYAAGAEWAAEAATWLEGLLAYAVERGVPIWSASDWLYFTEVRHDADLRTVRWEPASQRLSFAVDAQSAPECELTVMIPLFHGQARLARVDLDGTAVQHTMRRVGGLDYGCVSIPAGSRRLTPDYTPVQA